MALPNLRRPLLLAAVALAVLLLLAAACNAGTGYLPGAAQLMLATVYGGVLWVLSRLLYRWRPHRFSWGAMAVACSLYFAVQLWAAQQLRYTPAFDVAALYKGAQAWADGLPLAAAADPTVDFGTYFYKCTNNRGGTALLALAFRLGGAAAKADPFFFAAAFNALLITAALAATVYTGNMLAGPRCGYLVLTAWLLYPPLWFGAPAFYTDFLSLPFPITAVCLFLCAYAGKTPRRRAVFYALAALCAALGGLIKATPILCLLPPLALLLFARRWREMAYFACCCAAAVLLCSGALNAAARPVLPDTAAEETCRMPLWHWVMMSFWPEGNGGYRPADFDYTDSFPAAQRAAADKRELAARLRQMGPAGVLRLGLRKWAHCYGSGTLGYEAFLDDTPARLGALHALLLPGGALYEGWYALCGGILLYMLAAEAMLLWRCAQRRCPVAWAVLPLGALMLALFLLVWETDPRYITNFVPLMVLCGPLCLCGTQER